MPPEYLLRAQPFQHAMRIFLISTLEQMMDVKFPAVKYKSRMAHVRHVMHPRPKVARRSHATTVAKITMEWLQMVVKALQSFVPLYQVDRALHVLQLKPVDAMQWFAMQEKVTQTIILPMDAK